MDLFGALESRQPKNKKAAPSRKAKAPARDIAAGPGIEPAAPESPAVGTVQNPSDRGGCGVKVGDKIGYCCFNGYHHPAVLTAIRITGVVDIDVLNPSGKVLLRLTKKPMAASRAAAQPGEAYV